MWLVNLKRRNKLFLEVILMAMLVEFVKVMKVYMEVMGMEIEMEKE